MALILIVDGDPLLSEVMQRHFQRQGHQVLAASTCREALSLAEQYCPDAIVLSAALPECSVSEAYRRLRAAPSSGQTPLLTYNIHLQLEEEPGALAHKSSVHARRSSPFSELAARTNALLRRGSQQQAPTSTQHLIAGKLILHGHDLTVEHDGQVTRLTPTEFALLRYLMLHVDEACSSRRLLENVWGYPPGSGSTDVVRTHIMNLRNKIEENPAHPSALRTVRNCGYMLCSDGCAESRRESWVDGGHQQAGKVLRYSVTTAMLEQAR